MYVVYLYPNDGTNTVTLATCKRKNAAIRTVTERTLTTDQTLSRYPRGKVVVRAVFQRENGDTGSHVIRSWDVSNLLPMADPRSDASGTGSVRAFGANRKGKVSGRNMRTRRRGSDGIEVSPTVPGSAFFKPRGLPIPADISDTVGALATLRKHPVSEHRYAPQKSEQNHHLKPNPAEPVFMPSPA